MIIPKPLQKGDTIGFSRHPPQPRYLHQRVLSVPKRTWNLMVTS